MCGVAVSERERMQAAERECCEREERGVGTGKRGVAHMLTAREAVRQCYIRYKRM